MFPDGVEQNPRTRVGIFGKSPAGEKKCETACTEKDEDGGDGFCDECGGYTFPMIVNGNCNYSN